MISIPALHIALSLNFLSVTFLKCALLYVFPVPLSLISRYTGAKRKLTQQDGTFFFETVSETNGFDSIRLELSEHPWPCKVLYAHLSTERVDDNTCIFRPALEYIMADGVPEVEFTGSASWLGQKIADMGKELMASNSHVRFPTLSRVQGEAESKFWQNLSFVCTLTFLGFPLFMDLSYHT